MNCYGLQRNPPPNVYIPYDYWCTHTPVDLYKKAGKCGCKEPKKQTYGKRTNRKWAVS